MGVIALTIVSCSKDEESTTENDTTLTEAEVQTVLETNGVSGAADNIVRDIFNSEESGESAKNSCYVTTYFDTGFTVSFDNCRAEENGAVLDGGLTVTYQGTDDSLAYTITFDDLMVGDMALKGTRSFVFSAQNDNSIVYEVTSDMTVTMANEKVVSENGTKTFAFILGEEWGTGKLTIDGDWTLQIDSDTYRVSVDQLLETNFGCEHIGKGIMILNKNGLEVSLDFGDGDCDDMASLTYPDGTEVPYMLKK